MEYDLFPFGKIRPKEKIIIYGLGVVGKGYVHQIIDTSYCDIVLIIDNNYLDNEYMGIPVKKFDLSENEIKECDKVLIAVRNKEIIEEIKQSLCLSYNNIDSKIVIQNVIHKIPDLCARDMIRRENPCFRDIFNESRSTEMIIGLPQFLINNNKVNEYKNKIIEYRRCYPIEAPDDGVRIAFLWINLQQILKNTNGEVAELGVYKGATAKILHKECIKYNRKLYLFDTFKSFSKNDLVEIDEDKNESHFIDTSVEAVKEYLGNDENLIIKEGYFPDSADEQVCNEKFAFVHIDCDLYKPIKAGLEFFSQRLVQGGIMVIHDYYSGYWAGATKAVDEFIEQGNWRKIILPDMAGSVIIMKF